MRTARLFALTMLAGLLTFAACDSGDQGEGEPEGEVPRRALVIGTFSDAIDYSPLYVAQQFGWFEAALGDSVSFRQFDDRGAITAALDAGSLDILFAAMPPIAITVAQGSPMKIIELSCTLQQELVVRTSLPVSTLADLQGRSIAVLRGTSSHYGLLKSLGRAGVPADQVRLVYQGPGEAQPAFESGAIDAWAVWPPFVEEQVVSGLGKVLSDGREVIQSVVAASGSLLSEHADLARVVTDVVRRSKQWMMNNPEEAQVIVARRLNIDPAVVELAWGKHDWAARIDSQFQEDLTEKIEFLRQQDLLRRGAPASLATDLVDTGFGGAGPLD